VRDKHAYSTGLLRELDIVSEISKSILTCRVNTQHLREAAERRHLLRIGPHHTTELFAAIRCGGVPHLVSTTLNS
jgi:hypothetical protein